MHRLYYLLFILFIPFVAAAQQHADRIVPLASNPVLTELAKQKAKDRITPPPPIIKVVKLPFLDDFSKPSYIPDTNLWINGGVFTNYTYPVRPRTLGVATFDGVNGAGMPYNPNAALNLSYPADTLTSQFIGLAKYSPVDSIYLSFWWQVGGYGTYPKTNDSLILEFSDGYTWTPVWYHLGFTPLTTADSEFHFVSIPVTDPRYFINGFQFRFRSYACTAGNLDHWNIDFVYMDWLRSNGYADSLTDDIAFVYQSPPLIKRYTYMPWEQFTSNDIKTIDTNLHRNNSSVLKNSIMNETITGLTSRNYSSLNYNFVQGWDTCSRSIYDSVNFPFTPLSGPATWNITYVLNTSLDIDRWNDTLRHAQVFSDYFAYDDGTAEAGYSIINVNSPPTMLAMQFKLNNTDTLQGVQLFFNYVVSNASGYIFRLSVWSDGGGQPGTLAYEDDNLYSPVYDSLNHFAYYQLKTPLTLSGTVYIGFIQTLGDTINIGYDWNDNRQYQTFYDAGFGWNYSSFTGTPMLRPVFGRYSLNGVNNAENSKTSLTLYPNPARDEVNLNESMLPNTTIRIYASDGRLCFENEHFSGNSVNTSQLTAGFYIVELIQKGFKPTFNKLVISR